MAKAKKRGAARKKSSKRSKATVKPARKKAAKRTGPKKAKSQVRQARGSAAKSKTRKKRPPSIPARKPPRKTSRKGPTKTPRPVMEGPIENTIIDVIEEPVPGVVVVTEYETLQTATPEPKPSVGPDTEEN